MNSSEEPLVSVVTPVYNGEKYIAECIESVLAQTYSNWEYVIVNNCSTDRTPEIINSYSGKDERVRIHDNERHLSHLENGDRAFQVMSPHSKYCKVLHADDWMFPECLTKMVEVAEKYPTAGIVSSYRLDDRKVNLDGLSYPSYCTSGKEIGKSYLLDGSKYYFGSPSSLLIRSDLIRKRKKMYDETSPHSDVSACLDLLRESDFGFVHQVLTFTRRHGESVTDKLVKSQFSYKIGKFINVLKFGPDYLSEDELRKKLKELVEGYHKHMTGKFLLMRSPGVFRCGLDRFNSLEVPGPYKHIVRFSYLKFIKHLIIELFDLRRNIRWLLRSIR
jgi:glycosyltransferase involved in cell wall biosynthesis